MIIGAFAVVYFVWGSTYLANAWAVRSIPPFLLAGLRFFFAGLLMLLVGLALKQAKVTARQWRNAFIAGFLLFVVGNGALVWSLQYIDSGIVALVVAFEPLLVVLLQWKMRGRRPTIDTLIGIFLGVVGMGLLVGQPTFLADPNWLVGLGAIFLGMLAWAYVSVWIPTADLPNSNFQSAALQMLSGGVLLLVISVFTGDIARFDWTQVLIWRFVIISPMTHGILLFALIIGGFQGIQSFFLGWPIRSRLVLYANPWLRCGPYSGRVDRFGLLAVEIINPQGRHNLSYLTLSRKGYSLLPEGGEETFLGCTLAPDLNVTGEEPKRALQDLLALCPYTDWNHPPSIRLLSDQNDHLVLNVNLLTSRFEGPFRNLLQEAGFRSVRNQPATHHPFTSHDIVD